MTQTPQDVGMSKPNFPVELRDAVIQYMDDRASYRKHIKELTEHAKEMKTRAETLVIRNNSLEERLDTAELRIAWNANVEAYVENLQDRSRRMAERNKEVEESLRVARITQDAACSTIDALHKKIRELSRQLAGARAAKTKLKKRLT